MTNGEESIEIRYYLSSLEVDVAAVRPGRSGATGRWRTPSQKTREATTCASPEEPITIAVDALLALAAWSDRNSQDHGGTSCSTTTPSASPPPTAPPPNPLTAIWTQLPPDRRRRLQRLLAELLARPLDNDAAAPGEASHDHPLA